MNADIRWIDNRYSSESGAAHSDHDYFTNYDVEQQIQQYSH